MQANVCMNPCTCLGQSYGNAAHMSRKYNGNQAILYEKCNVAHYMPCTAHSINLVGKSAAGCPAAVRFFCLLQNLYTRLVATTHR